jgi:hypothetical protein
MHSPRSDPSWCRSVDETEHGVSTCPAGDSRAVCVPRVETDNLRAREGSIDRLLKILGRDRRIVLCVHEQQRNIVGDIAEMIDRRDLRDRDCVRGSNKVHRGCSQRLCGQPASQRTTLTRGAVPVQHDDHWLPRIARDEPSPHLLSILGSQLQLFSLRSSTGLGSAARG